MNRYKFINKPFHEGTNSRFLGSSQKRGWNYQGGCSKWEKKFSNNFPVISIKKEKNFQGEGEMEHFLNFPGGIINDGMPNVSATKS